MFVGALILVAASLFVADGSPEASGWTKVRDQAQDEFSVKDGVLTMVCSPNPYKGASYQRPVAELPGRGELSFEVYTFVGGYDGTGRYFLQVCFDDVMISFAGESMLRYFAAPKPNWLSVARGRVKPQTWTKVRVRWDNTKRTVKYYVGDMRVPSFVEEDAAIGMDKGRKAHFLTIGNYGLAPAFQTHRLRNIELKACDDGDGAAVERDMALVFCGLTSEFQPVESWTKSFPSDKVMRFYLEYTGLNYNVKNALALSAAPDDDVCRAAKLIILCDMPLESRVLSYRLQEMLLAAVRDGARMVVTGGLSGLEKCGDYASPIAKALPVKLEGPWRRVEPEKSVAAYGKGKIAVLAK